MPLVRKFCIKKGFVDFPDERKVHNKPIPRLGGVAIWSCTVLAFIIFGSLNSDYVYGNCFFGIFAGGSIIFLLGLFDDLYDLSPDFKLFIQIIAALVAFILGVRIEFISNPFGEAVILGAFSLPITILWLVGITNAVNFIDGLDGLAGGVITISAVTLGVIAICANQPESAFIAALLAGSMMGFLLFNFHPAKIFMGDSGALFSGFVLASLSVVGVMKSVTISVLLPILIFGVPIIDMLFSVFRRLLKGLNPMNADNNHIHHKLLKAGLSQNRSVVVLYLLCVAGGAIATFLVGAHKLYLHLMIFVFLLMAIFSGFAKIRNFKELKQAGQK